MTKPRPNCITCDRPYTEEDPYYTGGECWPCRCKTREAENVETLTSATRRKAPTRRKISQ